jgi:hypothetical protein
VNRSLEPLYQQTDSLPSLQKVVILSETRFGIWQDC